MGDINTLCSCGTPIKYDRGDRYHCENCKIMFTYEQVCNLVPMTCVDKLKHNIAVQKEIIDFLEWVKVKGVDVNGEMLLTERLEAIAKATQLAWEKQDLEKEIKKLKEWQTEIMKALPVGYIPDHTPENAVKIIESFLSVLTSLSIENDTLTDELDELKQENLDRAIERDLQD